MLRLALCLVSALAIGCTPVHAVHRPKHRKRSRKIAALRERLKAKGAENVALLDSLARYRRTTRIPTMLHCAYYATAVCEGKSQCTESSKGYTADATMCQAQMLSACCRGQDREWLCGESESISVRRIGWLACLGQISTHFSCDYSEPMDLCAGQYLGH